MKLTGTKLFISLATLSFVFAIQVFPQLPGMLNKGRNPEKNTKPASEAGTSGEFWFFAKASMASRKRIPVSELKVCVLGDSTRPPNTDQFKDHIISTTMNQARLLNSGGCDVASVHYNEENSLEKLKKERVGFAIYKTSGTDLELVFAPESSFGGAWVAVARKGLNGGPTLSKKAMNGCGHPDLRGLFRPTPRNWLGWSQGYVKFEGLKNQHATDSQNLLDNKGCDLWVMSSDDHPKFVKLYGAGYEVYSVDPEKDELVLRK